MNIDTPGRYLIDVNNLESLSIVQNLFVTVLSMVNFPKSTRLHLFGNGL